ncbi:MAG: hypothetical protein AAF337_01190 [Pseudomonadota bacterium]
MRRLVFGVVIVSASMAVPAASQTFEVTTPQISVQPLSKRFEVTTPMITARPPSAVAGFTMTTPTLVVRPPQPGFTVTTPTITARPPSKRFEVTTPTITAMASPQATELDMVFDQLFPGPTGIGDKDDPTNCPPVYAFIEAVKNKAKAGLNIDAEMQKYAMASMAGMGALMQADEEGWCDIVAQKLK